MTKATLHPVTRVLGYGTVTAELGLRVDLSIIATPWLQANTPPLDKWQRSDDRAPRFAGTETLGYGTVKYWGPDDGSIYR